MGCCEHEGAMMQVELTKERIQEICQLRGYAETAAGEMASDACGSSADFNYEKEIKSMKKRRIPDIQGALADHIFNDADAMSDLLGDRLSDLMYGWGWRHNSGQNDVWNKAVDSLADMLPHIREGLKKRLYYPRDK